MAIIILYVHLVSIFCVYSSNQKVHSLYLKIQFRVDYFIKILERFEKNENLLYEVGYL